MLKRFLLDLIFPRFCVGCQKEMNLKQVSFICEACFNEIPLNIPNCHICDSRNSGTCRQCLKKTNLSGIFSAGKYENQVLREAIHRFKYQSAKSLKKPLAELLVKYLKKENLVEKFSNHVLVPIPLTWRRKLSRGFNQSQILAEELSPVLNCQVINLLKRQKFNAPQAKIPDWKQRKENISGAFSFNKNYKVLSTSYPLFTRCRTSGKLGEIEKVILVDDVTTSGATLEEAARVLKEAGVMEVYGLVIAKG